jgi:hypothetical protein
LIDSGDRPSRAISPGVYDSTKFETIQIAASAAVVVAEAHQTLILRGFAFHNVKVFDQMNLGAVASQLSVSIQ